MPPARINKPLLIRLGFFQPTGRLYADESITHYLFFSTENESKPTRIFAHKLSFSSMLNIYIILHEDETSPPPPKAADPRKYMFEAHYSQGLTLSNLLVKKRKLSQHSIWEHTNRFPHQVIVCSTDGASGHLAQRSALPTCIAITVRLRGYPVIFQQRNAMIISVIRQRCSLTERYIRERDSIFQKFRSFVRVTVALFTQVIRHWPKFNVVSPPSTSPSSL